MTEVPIEKQNVEYYSQPEPKDPSEYKYRYVCEACSGVAFHSSHKKPPTIPIECRSCLTLIYTFKEDNYIPL